MTTEDLKNVLTAIDGFSEKVTYFEWPVGNAPSLPFICYYSPSADTFGADNKVYYQSKRFVIELYTLLKDFDAETKVEEALTDTDIFYTKTSSYLEDENCFVTYYEVEV